MNKDAAIKEASTSASWLGADLEKRLGGVEGRAENAKQSEVLQHSHQDCARENSQT